MPRQHQKRGDMQAIPTTYSGVRFRSRLEASWAAHFDARQMPWDYEPDGFALTDGTWYLPDFYLPTARAWAEVKGDHQERLSKVEAFAAELWRGSGATDAGNDQHSPMVLLLGTPRRIFPDADAYSGAAPINVLGPGKRGSAFWARCKVCRTSTVVACGQRFCRACGHVYHDSMDLFDPDWCYYGVPFQYLAAP